MKSPEARIEVDVRGTLVGFVRRDIRQLADSEHRQVEQLVVEQQREAGSDRTVTRIVILTDYPDPDRLSYTTSYRVDVSGGQSDSIVGDGCGQ